MQRSTLYIGQKTSNTFLYICLVKLVDCFTTQTLEQLQLLCSGSAVYCVGYSKTNQHKLTTVFSLKKERNTFSKTADILCLCPAVSLTMEAARYCQQWWENWSLSTAIMITANNDLYHNSCIIAVTYKFAFSNCTGVSLATHLVWNNM